MQEIEAECVVDSHCGLGESPTWHPASGSVYWSDISACELHRLQLETGRHDIVLTGHLVSGMAVERDDSLLLLGRWGSVLRFDAGAVRPVHGPSLWHLGFRFNDCIADPRGRVFAGIMGYEIDLTARPWLHAVRRKLQRLSLVRRPGDRAGGLCLLTGGRSIRHISGGIGRPNGMAFSPDLRTLYVTDSARRVILAFAYDVDTGRVERPRVLVDSGSAPGVPDGLVVDEEGCLWSARHRSGEVIRYGCDGRRIGRISLPVHRVTSLTFAGEELTELFITSAGGGGATPAEEHAGGLFRASPGVKGGPEWRSHVGMDGHRDG